MKKFKYLLLAVTLIGTVFTGCKDENEVSDPNAENIYSTNTVNGNKENIENSGFEMYEELKQMENEPAIDVNAAMIHFMDISDPLDSKKSASFMKIMGFEAIYALGNYTAPNNSGIYKSMALYPTSDPETLQELYDELVGVYEWNKTTSTWDYTQTGDKIILKFPSTEDGRTNNADYTLIYKGITIDGNILQEQDEYYGDFPLNVSLSLTVDGNVISSIVSAFTYSNEGIPTSASVTITVGAFEMAASVSNNNTNAGINYSLKHSNKILIAFNVAGKGNWTQENIDANFITKYYVWGYDETTGNYTETEVTENDEYDYSEQYINGGNIFYEGNLSIILMDLKVLGTVDGKNLIAEMDAVVWPDWDENTTNEEYEVLEDAAQQKELDALNKNIRLTLRYTANNEIIAVCEAYMKTYTRTEYYYWDENLGTWVYSMRDVEYKEPALRFVFADGSKIDAETYFNSGFDDLMTELENYFESL